MHSVFAVLGGLGLFLYGTRAMSRSAQQLTSARLKAFIQSVTSSHLAGVISGALATAIVQVSAVTTVMAVSFVNAGIITLSQAISVILGAHIGTTVTGQIIAFPIREFALPIIALGAIIHLFSRAEKSQSIGEILFGFGILLFGLTLMTEAFEPLRSNPLVRTFIEDIVNYPLAGLCVGMILTMIVQSSSVTIALTITLAFSQLISFEQAVPLILGQNIGTTITANIAAISGSIAAKRTARAHFLINAIGALLAMILLRPFMYLVRELSPQTDVARQIANAHTIFNVLTTILFFPFINLLARATEFLVRGKKEQQELYYLEETSLTDPSVALDQAKRAIIEMARHSIRALELLSRAIVSAQQRDGKGAQERIELIDRYHRRITEYLERVMQEKLSQGHVKEIQKLVRMVHELERMQDNAEKIQEVTRSLISEERHFPLAEKKEIRLFFKHVGALVSATREMIEDDNPHRAREIMQQYDALKNERDLLREKSNRRYSTKRTAIVLANYYNDVISALEETGKKCRNIALIMID